VSSDKLDLADVQKQIYNWRINKSHNNIAIPIEIKQAISSLIGQYSGNTIRKTLGLSGDQYKKLKKNNISNDNYKNTEPTKPIFKKIFLPATTSIYQAVIENNNGCKLKLQLSSINELTFIITNFIGGKNNASIS
jgi:hypothetical protein